MTGTVCLKIRAGKGDYVNLEHYDCHLHKVAIRILWIVVVVVALCSGVYYVVVLHSVGKVCVCVCVCVFKYCGHRERSNRILDKFTFSYFSIFANGDFVRITFCK